MEVVCSLILPITIEKTTRYHKVHVVPRLWRSCIIGNDLIRKHNLQIDGGRQLAYFKQKRNHTQQTDNAKDKLENEDEYILLAKERMKLAPLYAFNIEVKPNRPFSHVDISNESDQYEIKSLKHTPCVANGIITPREYMTLQVANLTDRTIIIHINQPLARMTILNRDQINMMQHSKIRSQESTNKSNEEERPNLIDCNLNDAQKKKLEQLITKFPDVFGKQTGRTNKLKHRIKLTPDTQPINSPPFRYSPARRKLIEENLNEMIDQGIISPSSSPWAAPVILAPKKDGSLRFCIDYRKLNSTTIRDAYPIPRIDDTLDSLQEGKFISTLDLRSGYWQVEMDEDSKDKTAFITHKGLFEFNVMPFGLTNAPATFQRLMDMVLAGLKWQCCLVYIDDVVIYSPTFEQHLVDLEKVFQALKSANLTLKLSKCQFCRQEMRYLGHVITPNGIKPDPDLVEAVTKFPQPKKVKDVQSFLGLTGYYRRFIKDYARIAEPLLEQLRNAQRTNHHINWSQKCTDAFEVLKKKLTNAPIMDTPNFEQPFILELDACEYGLGAVLNQEFDGKKFVIAYASRTLSSAERKYSATEREALAIVWATKHFRPYLEGNRIFIRSDCRALEWMRTAKDVTGRLARWAMKLSAYQIEEIRYRPGKLNGNADSLSRNPIVNKETIHQELSTIETTINIWETINDLKKIKEEQRIDNKLKNIIQTLETETQINRDQKRNPYVLINGLLYKIKNSHKDYNQRKLGTKHLLVIPKTMQPEMLKWAHDHPTAGHGGQQRTLFRLSQQLYWQTMRKDVHKYVAACEPCQQFKYNNSPTSGPMQQHIVNEPWHTVGIDIMGPFPPTIRHKRFLLVVVDYFTRWIEVFPMRSITSTDIANILTNEVLSRYGLPKHIVSDNGPQFVSNIFKCLCTTLGMKQNLTANYHPQSNMTERVNRTLKPLIAIYAQQQPQTWDREIQKLAFAMRTSVNETTGETPAFLMFGRDPRGPLDVITGDGVDGPPTTEEETQTQQYKRNLINSLQRAYKTVKEHSEIEKLKQKTKYDRHTTEKVFQEGDLVWISMPAGQINHHVIHGKLQPSYQGPCQLIKQLTPVTFTVQRLSDQVMLGATNIDRMKKYTKYNNNQHETTITNNDRQTNEQETSTRSNRIDYSECISHNENMSTKTSDAVEINRSTLPRVSDRRRRVPRRLIDE